MKLFRIIWQDIQNRQNFDVYITIVLAIIVAILGTFGLASQSIISSAILATLGLLSFSVLANRRENEDLSKHLAKIREQNVSPTDIFKRDYDRLELREVTRNARKVFFWGFSFTTSVPMLGDYILTGVQDGLEARFLLVEPSSNSARMAVFGASKEAESDFDMSIKGSLVRLSRFQKSSTVGKLEVRVVDYFPPYRIIAIDPHLPTGRMIVRMTSPTRYRDGAPVFELTRAKDEKWFDYFATQFEYIWANANEYDKDSNL